MDTYTKIVLTAIALALWLIVARDIAVPAFAQRIIQVELCGQEVNPKTQRTISCAEMLTDNDGIRRLVVTR